MGFIVVNADFELWLNGITKRNFPIPSDFDRLSYAVCSSSLIISVEFSKDGITNLVGRWIVIGVS